jgi:hypothetical protein
MQNLMYFRVFSDVLGFMKPFRALGFREHVFVVCIGVNISSSEPH